jgi:hypothetical protein
MITYEATMICDRCPAGICGEVKDTPKEAETEVQRVAEKNGWRRNEFGDLCPECRAKEPEAQ